MAFAIRKAALQDTQRYKLDSISPDQAKPITLIVRHAGESNRLYMSALVKEVNVGRSANSMRATEDGRQTARLDFAERFTRDGVVVGWENVVEDGKPVVFSTEAAHRFLLEVIAAWPDVFDDFRAWCQNWDSFRTPVADPVDLGKG